MVKYLSVEEMVAIEKESDAGGNTYPDMMEAAGKGLAEIIHEYYADLENKRALGLIGTGNNGGDTLVALTYLKEWGWEVAAYEVKGRDKNDELVDRFKKAKGYYISDDDDNRRQKLSKALNAHSVLLDGVFGTGIRLPLRGDIPETLDYVREKITENPELIHVVAVDCPSGIDCDSGEAAPVCIPAELTVTMAAVKQGLLKFPAYDLVGDLDVVDIGLPAGLESMEAVKRIVVDRDFVSAHLPERPNNSHKGTFGTSVIVAGSVNYMGAARLAGESAYRIGSGLVTLAVISPVQQVLAGELIEATWILLPHELGVIGSTAASVLKKNLGRATAMLIGPGFGTEETTRKFIENLLYEQSKKHSQIGFIASPEKIRRSKDQPLPPMVIDADGLRLLVQLEDWSKYLPSDTVLTPHPGEMAVMTKLEVDEIQADRIGVAERFAKEWGHVIVLKGAFTVIAHPDGRTAIIPVATSALAKAGSGDVLAGMITGLIAQGVKPFEAACCGAWIHAQAGLVASELLGGPVVVMARDVMDSIIEVMAMF